MDYDDSYRIRTGPGWLGVVITSLCTSCAVLLAFLAALQQGYLKVNGLSAPPAASVTPAIGVQPATVAAHVKVPTVTGLPASAAAELLSARGLRMVVRAKRPGPAVADTVLVQDPLAESMLPRDAQVVVVLSSGPPTTSSVPELSGKPLSEAVAALEALGLKAGEVSGPSEGERVVLGSQPAAGSALERGALVKLAVGVAGIEVPKLTGIQLNKAKKLLLDAGLKVGKIGARYDDDAPNYVILKQTPEPGQTVEPGSSVDLVYSEE